MPDACRTTSPWPRPAGHPPRASYFPVGSYLILYREITGGVEIVRVVHGARDLPDLFETS